MTADIRVNSDLIWQLGNGQYKSRAVEFIKHFESKLCIFSSTVSQVYSNYELMPVYGQDQMIVLPNPYAYHDTFENVTENAIVASDYYLVLSEQGSRTELMIARWFKKSGKLKALPFMRALESISKQRAIDNPFLPVIMNKDMSKLSSERPVMPLHQVDLSRLDHMSAYDRKELQEVIQVKIGVLAA